MRSEMSAKANRRIIAQAGSVLVCVLVVLLLVGLLMTQTIQTLVVLRKGDGQRRQVQQARELLELGKMVARRPRETAEVFEQRILVDASTETYGSIRLEALSEYQLRIVARFPDDDENNPITASEVITIPELNK